MVKFHQKYGRFLFYLLPVGSCESNHSSKSTLVIVLKPIASYLVSGCTFNPQFNGRHLEAFWNEFRWECNALYLIFSVELLPWPDRYYSMETLEKGSAC